MHRFLHLAAFAVVLSCAMPGRAMIGPVENTPPIAAAIDSAESSDSSTVSLATAPAFSDPDGDVLSFSAVGLPGWLAIDADTGVISGSLANNTSASAPLSITVTATDPFDASASVTFTLTVTNPAPTTSGIAAQAGVDGGAVAIAAGPAFSDPDGDALTYSASGLPAGLSIDPATGAISGTLANNASATSPFAITVTATDAQGAAVSTSFTLTVNNPAPTTSGIAAQAGVDGGAVAIAAGPAFSDPDGDALTYSASGLPAGLSIDSATGAISGALANNASATSPFAITVTATDAQGAAVSTSFTLTVTNPAPTTSGIAAQAGVDGGAVAIAAGPAFSDPDGDALTYSASGLPAGLSIDPVTGAISGALANNASATSPFAITVTATDAQGAAVSTAFTLTVTNPAPTTSGIAAQAGVDGGAVAIAAGPAFSDPDGDALTYSASGLPAGLSIDPVTGAISGALANNASATSPFAITITATDAQGAAVSATFTLTVINPAPSAGNDVFTTSFATALHASVSGNDSDPDGDALTFKVATGPIHGSVVLNTDGSLVYAPAGNFAGADSFTYTVTDAQGATATATVAIDVAARLNTAPSAVDDSFTSPSTAISASVADNDSDADGDALTFAVTAQPAHGTLAFADDGSFTYTPADGYHGADTFAYSATDTAGVLDSATVTITVIAPPLVAVTPLPVVMGAAQTALRSADDAPCLQVADADSITLTVALSVMHGTLVAPELAGVTLVEGDSAGSARLVLHGPVAAINLTLGALLYHNGAGACGADTLQIEAVDADGLSDLEAATVTLGAVLIAGRTNAVPFVNCTLDASLVRGTTILPREADRFDSIAVEPASAEAVHLVSTPRLFDESGPRSGSIDITLSLADGSTCDVIVPVLIYSARLRIAAAPRLNPQTSLYEQTVEVINSTPATLEAFQLIFAALPAGVTLYSSTGTSASGDPVIASAGPLAPDATAAYLVQYTSMQLVAFAQPSIALRLAPASGAILPEGPTREVDRIIALAGRNYLEFATTAGEVYWIQYRDSATGDWITSASPVSGSGSSIHWLDAGEPMTSGTPSAARHYRLLVTPAGILPLQITRQPASITAAPGDSATLAVGAIGPRAIAYQWFHDGRPLAGANRSFLELASVDAVAEGDYRVSITDGRATVWSTAARVSLGGARPARITNLSVRARIGAEPLITGFVFNGRTPHTIAARAIGPSLARFGVAEPVRNPRARLFAASTAIAENDDWAGDPRALEADETFDRIGAFSLAPDSADAALLRTLKPGAYTMYTINGGEAGVALAELFETGATAGLVNISGRARITSGEGALIAGFTIDGQSSVRVMIRAVGPGLERFGVAGVLTDPRLAVYRSGSDTPIASNDDWADEAAVIREENLFAFAGAFGLAAGSRDAVLVLRLPPGIYTAVASGPAGAAGEALVEVYLISR